VTINGRAIHLTPREFQVVCLLAENRGVPVSAADLVKHLRTSNITITENAIEVLIGRLRRKLGDNAVQTRRGFGYFLTES
jgi:DNA-binding response OmpR family regulator